jgi:hypothetical protein
MDDLLHESIKLKEITPRSWLMLNETNSNVGILSQGANSNFVAVANGGYKGKFENREAVCEYFGNDIFDTVVKVEQTEKENYINGFPVSFDDPVAVETESENRLPLYTKTESGTAIYAAGHYILHFPKNSLLAFCPKYNTLKKYKYEGPFKTEFEVKTVLLQIKRNQKND